MQPVATHLICSELLLAVLEQAAQKPLSLLNTRIVIPEQHSLNARPYSQRLTVNPTQHAAHSFKHFSTVDGRRSSRRRHALASGAALSHSVSIVVICEAAAGNFAACVSTIPPAAVTPGTSLKDIACLGTVALGASGFLSTAAGSGSESSSLAPALRLLSCMTCLRRFCNSERNEVLPNVRGGGAAAAPSLSVAAALEDTFAFEGAD